MQNILTPNLLNVSICATEIAMLATETPQNHSIYTF